MQLSVQFGDRSYSFEVWLPGRGDVFIEPFSFDCETTLIDDERPWLTPAYVIGAATDGKRGVFVPREHVAAFLHDHRGVPVVMHNAPFDLAVLQLVAPKIDLYRMVDHNLVWDTQLLHKLLVLGDEGYPAHQSSLAHCAEQHLGLQLDKHGTDDNGRDIRTSFDRYLGRSVSEIDERFLTYLAKDALATILVFNRLQGLIEDQVVTAKRAWGYVSKAWSDDCIRRWGPQTHHIQLRAAIVLQSITANGLPVDTAAGDQLKQALESVASELRERLKKKGYMPGQKGCNKALQEILRRLVTRNPDLDLPRTPSGNAFSARQDALAPLADREPFIADYIHFQEVAKLLNTFVGKLNRKCLHPSFNPLVKSGRTSSYGEINAQNLPRDDRVRQCIVAPRGMTFVGADYTALELATLAQACIGQFGQHSAMADAINTGQDLHRLVASRVTGKSVEDVTKDERQRAKAINFGKPGGMGNTSLRAYAKASYGVDQSEQEVDALSNAWLDLFPEMREFLRQEDDIGELVARFFELTPAKHAAATLDDRFLLRAEREGMEHRPSAPLGGMFLKTMRDEKPRTRDGRPYSDEDLDFFWQQAQIFRDDLPRHVHKAILARRPSKQLMGAVLSRVGRRGVFTLTGRLRANASFSARHNTVFQGLAADGAKLALWNLFRAGYQIHNFIHDEVLVAVPDGPLVGLHAEVIRHLMISGMRQVVPDVRIGVEYAVTRCWSKDAKIVRDESGRIRPWEPVPADTSTVGTAV